MPMPRRAHGRCGGRTYVVSPATGTVVNPLVEAVATARNAGVSWAAIASMLGTSGEAARKRFAVHHTTST